MSDIKLIRYEKMGKPAEVLTVVSEPSRTPDPHEARVKVLATPIHPSDLLQISGRYGIIPNLPTTPGNEGVGEVVEVGSGVKHLSVGQKVLLSIGSGTWRSELTTAAGKLIPLPSQDGDLEQLSMLAINPLTAWMMLKQLNLSADDWVVQSAANSAVGEYLIQMAKNAGIKTINIVRRESLVPRLKELGADVVLIDGSDLQKEIRSATNGAPLLAAIDAVGGDTLTTLMDSLSYGAKLISYGALAMKPSAVNPATLIFRGLTISGFWLAKWFETAPKEEQSAELAKVIDLIGSGKVSTSIDSRFNLDQIDEAVVRAAKSGRDGKVLLIPDHSQS